MIVDEDNGWLLGVTFVGPGVEELLHSATIAVAGQIPISRLWHAVPCFPSISEVWLRLLETYRGLTASGSPGAYGGTGNTGHNDPERNGYMVAWERVTHTDVLRAIREYDRLGPTGFFAEHGFAPTTTYELVWDERHYPPKAILGTAYEFATGQRLSSRDFEGGKTGAVRVLGGLGFTVQARRPAR